MEGGLSQGRPPFFVEYVWALKGSEVQGSGFRVFNILNSFYSHAVEPSAIF